MSRRNSPVPEWIPPDLPAAPGVYQFEDALGTPIYVGKSVNLRRRVRGYFYGGGPKDERMALMVRLARRIEVRRAGTDLEAKLEEADRIERFRPAFNKALKNRSKGWYIEVDWGAPFPRLRVITRPRRPRARHFGPYRGRRQPAEVVVLLEKILRLRSCAGSIRPDPGASPCLQHGIDQCTAPCVGLVGIDVYRAQVREAVRLLEDPSYLPVVHARFGRRRDRAAAAGGTDEAISWQRRLAWLEELDSYRYVLEKPWVDRSWLIVLPGPTETERVLLPVARGRVLERKTVSWSGSGWQEDVEDAVYSVRMCELQAEAVFQPADLTPSLIVTTWLESGAPDGQAFDLERSDGRRVVQLLRREERGRQDAKPERDPLEEPAPIRCVA
jgi:excinuclease UvrABC nuclease subunit